MDINTSKNWKYNIAFDNSAYKDIMHHCFLYERKERDTLTVQVEFYRKNFSFEQLIRSFRVLKDRDDIIAFKNAVIKRKQNILYMPSELKQYYLNLIKKDYSEHAEFLNEMLIFACNKKVKNNPMIPIYKNILGCYYGAVKRKIKKLAKQSIVKIKSEKPKDYNASAQEILKDLSTDTLTQGVWGKFKFKDLDIIQNSDYGTGKFISKHLYSSSSDTFLIQTKENRLTLDDLKLSIYGNVYPGRGNFLNTLLYKRSYNLDGGAEFVIHGWSVYSAWNVKPTTATNNSKIMYAKIAQFLFEGNWQANFSKLACQLLGFFSKDEATRLMKTISQYPGKFEGYILGAFATELLIEKKFATSPLGLIDEYKKRNLADFMGLFRPNTNKC